MFYPVESLKKGGRFYLCWVADSWPLRFATITHRQLWSQDIRRICDDLMEVMTNESGRPTHRFSLRLSSQLMRGLVRLYQRKVTVFLSDLCMINANVFKNTNKKWNVHEIAEVVPRPQQLQTTQLPLITEVVLPEEPENEQRIEEMIKNSGNVVSNIQQITLKESAIPDFQLPPNDGFGEEHPEQALQLLTDRSLETMRAAPPPAPGAAPTAPGDLSAPRLADKSHDQSHDYTHDKSHDQSHDYTHDKSRAPLDRHMERISEFDVTAMGRVSAEGLLPVADFEKEIPEIPEILPPELHAPLPENKLTEPEEGAVPVPGKEARVPETSRQQETGEIELEELQQTEPQTKRRRLKNKLIIDKKTKLTGNWLRARITNPAVELRCEDSSDDIVDTRVPCESYWRRASGAALSARLTRLFLRTVAVLSTTPLPDREMEEIMQRSHRPLARSILERIEEVEEPIQERPPAVPAGVVAPDVAPDAGLDISELLTQKVDTLSQARKRAAERSLGESPKRQRSMGYASFRQSQQIAAAVDVPIADQEAEKENLLEIDQQIQQPPKRTKRSVLREIPTEAEQQQTAKDTERSVTAMLQEAGLADIQPYQAMETEQHQVNDTQKSRRRGSDGTETPLGSLDRTKVSLGDSDQTTDSKRFIRDQWGTEGTMVKILKCIKAEVVPVNILNLTSKGPVIQGYKKIIIARCFTSILKLKQHGFIRIRKDPDTLEIQDIKLGPKFD